jgi:carboxymethylenebutenolidase
MTTVATQDGQMELYEAGDPATASRAIVVIQEAFGLTDHICRCVDRIAAEGYVAVAPALFHRDGAPVLAYDDLEHVMPLMGALSEQGIRMDLDATVGYLASLGFDRASTGIVGFCMGGTVAFRAGTTGMFGAAVTFYGGGVTAGRFGYPPLLELASDLDTPWLGCYGDLDKGIPVEEVEALRAAVQTATPATELVRYASAEHGFNCEDRPAVYNEVAAADAWARMLAFFDLHLRARP